MSNLTQFQILGFKGRGDLEVNIENDRLIIVGENGSGKTTLITMMFLFLSGQWDRLSQFQFREIRAVIAGEAAYVSTHHIKALLGARERAPIHISAAARMRLAHLTENYPVEVLNDREKLHELAVQHNLPFSMVRAFVASTEFDEAAHQLARRLRKQVLAAMKSRVLYLPTYRRIEQELAALFPNADPDRIAEMRRPTQMRPADSQFLELVEFGMEDVASKFARALESV